MRITLFAVAFVIWAQGLGSNENPYEEWSYSWVGRKTYNCFDFLVSHHLLVA